MIYSVDSGISTLRARSNYVSSGEFAGSFFLTRKFDHDLKWVDEGRITIVRRLTLNNFFTTKFLCFT